MVKINDTLKIIRDQDLPEELKYEEHKIKPFIIKDFEDKIFEFKNKSGLKVYKTPPVRNFLVENVDGK